MRKPEKQKIQKAYDPLEVGLPSAPWIEIMVIGIAIRFSDRMDELISLVNADDFSSEANRMIWMCCASMHERRVVPDYSSVKTELDESGQLEFIGGEEYLREVVYPINCPNIPSLSSYTRLLRDYAQRRKLIFKANEMLIEASQKQCDIATLLTDGSDALTKLASELSPEAMFKTPDVILQDLGGINAYGSSIPPERIVGTPFPALNEMLQAGGFVRGDLVVLAGHTSRGKSALAVTMAMHATYEGKRVVIVSLEMQDAAIFDRMVSLMGRIDGYRLHREGFNEADETARRQRIRESVGEVTRLPIAISYRPGVSPKKLLGDLKRYKAVNGLDFVVIDYLQLMTGTDRAGMNRSEEVGHVSRSLVRMAGELNVPILALSQFSRESAKQEREPELHDLKESGSIEQDAAVVMLMHVTRPWDIAAGVDTGEIKLKIAKQRNGAITSLPLRFHVRTGAFSQIS